VKDLAPGAKHSFYLTCKTSQVFSGNGGRQMVAIRTTCPEDGPHSNGFEFKYFPVVWTAAEVQAAAAGNSANGLSQPKPVKTKPTAAGNSKPATEEKEPDI
jgi:hypothetical protein